jgi:hypothetical protein
VAFIKSGTSSICPRFSVEVVTGRLLDGRFQLSDDVDVIIDPVG